ncbi:MAG: ABC transporter ATP-binding protein [Candidatus Omnitrophica bacterium]|nr:ABC transporter ATP-binding protein [Candidatus Omnitrophota bacterium]
MFKKAKVDSEPVIEVRNLVKNFGGRRVLNGVNLKIYKGEVMVIMGGSGCGKSTLLRHIIGILKPDSGQVLIEGKDINSLKARELDKIRLKIGMLFQSGGLLDYMTIKENIALPLTEHTNLDKNVIDIIVNLKLSMVNMRGMGHLLPSEISGGMKKRAGLARAIAHDPSYVFYDEPTAGLDPVVAGVIDKMILDFSKKLSVTSVVVTHEMQSVFRIASRIAMLHMGEIVEVGTPRQIKASKSKLVQQFITGSPDGPISFSQLGDDYLTELTKK